MKVFDIENEQCYVKHPMKCTMCRECIRDDYKWSQSIELEKKKQEFVFTVESVGIY